MYGSHLVITLKPSLRIPFFSEDFLPQWQLVPSQLSDVDSPQLSDVDSPQLSDVDLPRSADADVDLLRSSLKVQNID